MKIYQETTPARLESDYVYILYVEDEASTYEDQVVRATEKFFDQEHGLEKEKLRWFLAETKTAALAYVKVFSKIGGGARGFDLVFCDLAIPESNDEADVKHGVAVAAEIARQDWPCATIGLSAYTEEPAVIQSRSETIVYGASPYFDDLLSKVRDLSGSDENFIQKLKRSVVPLFPYKRLIEEGIPFPNGTRGQPYFLHGVAMMRILRELILLAKESHFVWPMQRILLLGESGAGKGAITQLFTDLTRYFTGHEYVYPETVNCAALTDNDQGGRVRLFGAGKGWQGIATQRGAFEQMTHYGKNGEPEAKSGGVVFLDEFVELHPNLQAAVLNTLEEGVVIRQIDSERIPIGCNVVFATNAAVRTTDSIAGDKDVVGSVRRDLIDRIPSVLTIPSVLEMKDYVPTIVKQLAASRLDDISTNQREREEIGLSKAVESAILECVEIGLIHSYRQLKSIARLNPGETAITESNLYWVLKKARLFNVPKFRIGKSNAEGNLISPSVGFDLKVQVLNLPTELDENILRPIVLEAIEVLYRRIVSAVSAPKFGDEDISVECREVCFLLAFFLPTEKRECIYSKPLDAIKSQRRRTAEKYGISPVSNSQIERWLKAQ